MYLRKYILCNVPFPERILQPDERHIANDDLHVCFFSDFYLLKYRTITIFCILKYFYAIALLTTRTYVL